MKHLRMPLVGLFVGTLSLMVGLGAASGQASGGVTVAVDADPTGNTPRSVASIETCISTSVGQPIDVDIVVPDPGIPADRGIALFALSLSYDPAIVRVTNDNTKMLLAQAPGSNLSPVPFRSPGDRGTYNSFALDFTIGQGGPEPNGSAEVGPGVLSRITLTPQSNGVSEFSLTYASLAGSLLTGFLPGLGGRIEVASLQSATIAVGEPCDQGAGTGDGGASDDADGGSAGGGTNDTGGEADSGSGGADNRSNDDAAGGGDADDGMADIGDEPTAIDGQTGEGPTDVLSLPPGDQPDGVGTDTEPGLPIGGGPPPRQEGPTSWIILAGLAGTLGGIAIIVASTLAHRRR